jgi:DNA-binding CsgD family transcriptional regulator
MGSALSIVAWFQGGASGMPKSRAHRKAGAMRPEKLVEFLEAAYAMDQDDDGWLKGMMRAACEVWGRPGWALASTYDAADTMNFRMVSLVSDFPPDLLRVLLQGPAEITPDYVQRTYRRLLVGITRNVSKPELKGMFTKFAQLKSGIANGIAINGLDPSGLGCMVGISKPDSRRPAAAEMPVYKRMALHMAAAYRCRRRLRAITRSDARPDPTVGAEAVFDSRGRILDASGLAKERASQDELKAALARFDAARSRRRGIDPIEGLAAHRALVEARWTLVNAYQSSGTRYVVARENQAAVRGLAALTERERQIAVYVSLDRSTKEVAYALGITDSTVRVLLSRAMSKLRVRSREQLIRRVKVDALPEFGVGSVGPAK